MSKEIYFHEQKSMSNAIAYFFVSAIIFLAVAMILGFLGPSTFDIGLIEMLILPLYSSVTIVGIPSAILYSVILLVILIGFIFLFGKDKQVGFYAEGGNLRKTKTWGMFSKDDLYRIEDIDYISVKTETILRTTSTQSTTGAVVSSNHIISLVMKGIDIKVIPIFVAKSPEIADKLAQEISNGTGIPLR